MGKKRAEIMPDAIALSEGKQALGNVDRVVALRGGAEVYVRPASFTSRAGRGGRVVIRGQHVKASHKLGTKAKAMKSCAGKHGKDFGDCLTSKGINAPRSLGGSRRATETTV